MEILYGLISSLIFGILNKLYVCIGLGLSKRRSLKALQKEINERFKVKNEKINAENIKEFFSLSQIRDMIEEYILSIAISKQGKRKPKKNKLYSQIDRDDFIIILTSKFSNLYDNTDEELDIVNECFEFIFSFCEEEIYKILKNSEKATLYFVNSQSKEYYNLIDQQLKGLANSIDCLLKRDIERPNADFDRIKRVYYQTLKDQYSEAHIYLLDKFQFDSFYVPPTLVYSPQNRFEERRMYNRGFLRTTTWDKIFINNNIIYVIGGAGYGKTLFLKKLINDYSKLYISDASDYLIIFGELKMFFPNSSDKPISVDQFLKDSMQTNTLLGDDISVDLIQHYLNMGRCIILLDALDEVDKHKRTGLHEKIIAYFKNQNPKNKICITSRDRNFIPEKNIEVYHIKPLSHKEIEQYVDNIIKLGRFANGDKIPFMQQAAVLIEKGFLNSFLVLSLLLNIFKAERELPENKLDLYSKCFEYITVKREKEKTNNRFNWQRISLLMKDNTFMALSQLGFPNNKDIEKETIITELTKIYKSKYSNENETINAVEEFLLFCSDRTELFVPSNSDDKYKFFHRSFFEYFYSLNLFVNYSSPNDLIDKFKAFDIDSEVFELTMSMLKQRAENKYQDVLSALFSEAEHELKNKDKFTCFNILILIMQIVDDIKHKMNFFELIIKYSDKIKIKARELYILSILPGILNGFDNYSEKICDVYYKESIIELLNQLSFTLEVCDQTILLETDNNDCDDLWYIDYNHRFRERQLFFFSLFLKRKDVMKELNDLDTNRLIELGVREKKLINCLKEFKSMDREMQESVIKYIK